MVSRLSLLSDRVVDAVAAFDITDSLDLHDPRFGNAGNNDVMCPTCNMRNEVCMGHHASLSLGMHMFHPLMYKESQKKINSTCLSCGSALLEVSRAKARKCLGCGSVNHGDYAIYTHDMTVVVRQNEPGSKLYAHSIPGGILPEGHIISKILVPPIHLRTPEDMEWPTDIQRLYEQLVISLRSNFRTDVCLAYSRVLGAHKREGITGIMSSKNGVFRELMMGKRVELSARAVVVGDPFLELDQVGVPRAIADSVRTRVSCLEYNIGNLRKMASEGALWWPGTDDVVNPNNIMGGMAFERCIVDGDLAMLNRQPSLSRTSLMCFRVVVRTDAEKVFTINPQITPPFNADFDGDEMNLFFMTDRAEMVSLCSISECRSSLLPVQDVVTGCYLMSAEDAPVSREVWEDCLLCAESSAGTPLRLPRLCLGDSATEVGMTTFGLLSMCIPGYDGRKLHKRDFRSFSGVDTHTLQLVVERWLSTRGLTVSLKSVTARPLTKGNGESTDSFRERCINRAKEDMSGTGIMSMIDSGAKGSEVHASHMAVALGQQYIGGKEGVFCERPYSRGLTQREFFGHQMAAREGVVSTGVGTASTGYLNRRACKIIADLKLQYNDTVADGNLLSSFHM
jgi:DNA-directed RNA polymerase beta' subunit